MRPVISTLQTTQYLTFWIAAEEFAAPLVRIREVIEYLPITRVPSTPGCIRGVINLRGTVLPVIDLAVKLALPETQVGRRTCIVLVEVEIEGESAVLGVMTERIGQVIDLTSEEIGPPPAFGTRIRVDYLLGLARLEAKFLLVLDLERMLSTEELLLATEIQTSTAAAGNDADAPALVPPAPKPGTAPDEAARPSEIQPVPRQEATGT